MIDPESSAVERLEHALAFRAEHGLPLVLKPDVGQRGSGVLVLRTDHELRERIADVAVPCLLQRYASGREVGLFWVHHPAEERGRIFSVTDKRMPVVVGDGERDLEHLILADERAICLAQTYPDANASRLTWVPAAGEHVELVHIGTHCRGAIFLEGEGLVTPELELAIGRIAARFPGFRFGRFDIRVPSEEALRAGRDLAVIELNGVTSESTNIHDPRHSLRSAYRILFEQWRIAYQIGAANIERGARPGTIGEIWREWRRYRRLQRAHGT